MSPHHTDYEAIPSTYIRRRIRETSWAKRHYIHDLCRLRHYLINGPRAWAEGMQFAQLKRRYPTEYLDLLEEIDPARALEARQAPEEERRASIRQREKDAIAYDKRQAAERESWLNAGGRA